MNNSSVNRQLAFIFPGQGSQSLGMMGALHAEFGCVAARFDAASEVLGFDLWDLVQNGPEERLNSTQNTQPALLAASVATWDAWLSCGGERPHMMAGHSFGEYSALVCAGALEFDTAVALVADRGRYMQEAVAQGQGAMAAILGLDIEHIAGACAEASRDGELATPANLNAPGQVVIAGTRAGVESACELARQRGAKKALMLAVSAPAHCALMAPAAEALSTRLNGIEFEQPSSNIVHNADVRSHSAADEIRQVLIQQMCAPVRWIETIESMSQHGITHLLECGPGKVLSALVKRIDRSLDCQPLVDGDAVRAQVARSGGDHNE